MVRPRDAGLSLVELMITLIIASLVAGSTFMFFAGQQTIYETQGKVLNLQQNLWATVESLSQHVRAAGTGMANCVRPDSDYNGPDTGDPPPGGPASPPTGVRAFRGGPLRIPPLWVRNGVAGAPDEITVAYGTGTFGNIADTTLTADFSCSSPACLISTATNVYRAGEWVLLVDAWSVPILPNLDRGCTLFRITGIGPTALQHDTSSPWNPGSEVRAMFPGPPPATYVYPAGVKGGVRNFGQLNWIRFFIEQPPAVGGLFPPPRLMMQRLEVAGTAPEVLAEGIEDMQVAYACDVPPLQPPPPTPPPGYTVFVPLAGDGVLFEAPPGPGRLADEWVFNWSGDLARADCNKPSAVRVTLVGRSLGPDPQLAALFKPGQTLPNMQFNFKPAAEDGIAGPFDMYRHRAITTTVSPRNRE